MTDPRIGYIGLGVMGGALARRLLRKHKLDRVRSVAGTPRRVCRLGRDRGGLPRRGRRGV